MATLIGGVTVTPTQVRPGQSVQVQVLDANNKPYTSDSDVLIAIDGIPVSSRFYQFATEGQRTLAVSAYQGATTDAATATINVSGAPILYHPGVSLLGKPVVPGAIPFLVLSQDLTNPYQVTFSLATPPAARAAAAIQVAAAAKAKAGKPVPANVVYDAPVGFTTLQKLFANAAPASVTKTTPPARTIGDITIQESSQHMIVTNPPALPAAQTSYEWSFGDGQTQTSTTPTVTHDYFEAIKPGQVPFAFDVSCRIVQDNITVTRTLILYSAYGMCDRNNTTVPHVEGDVFATLNSDKTSFSATLIVYNIETVAMTLNQMAIIPTSDDPNATFPAFSFTPMQLPISVAPQSSSLVAVSVLRSDLSTAAKGLSASGFTVAFKGEFGAATILHPLGVRTGALQGIETPDKLSPPIDPPTPVTKPPNPPTKDQLIAAQSIGTSAVNRLNPGALRKIVGYVVARTVYFTRNVRLLLQDQQLPPAQGFVFNPSGFSSSALDSLSLRGGTIVRSGGIAVDTATNVVSVSLTVQKPTPAQAAQVRKSVLSMLGTANVARRTP